MGRFAWVLLVLVILVGCTSTGTTDPNLSGRLTTDLACVLSLARQGAALSQGATTDQILDSIAAKSNDPVVLNACAAFLTNASQTAAGIKAKADAMKAKQAVTPAPAVVPTK